MEPQLKFVLFDIDGTLLLGGGSAKQAFCIAFEELFGIENAWGETCAHGRTDPDIIRDICRQALRRPLRETEYTALCEGYIRHFRDTVAQDNGFRLMPGIVPLCEELSDNDSIALGIETGNFEQTARLKLSRAGIEQYFSFGGYGSDSESRRTIIHSAVKRGKARHNLSQIPRKSIFVIGDSPQDIMAAHSLGAKVIAVCTGRSSAAELAQYEPEYLFEDLSDTEKVISILIEPKKNAVGL